MLHTLTSQFASDTTANIENAHIYAIYKDKTSSVLSQICAFEKESVDQALSARESSPLLTNNIGRIQCDSITLLPPGEKLRPLLVTSTSTSSIAAVPNGRNSTGKLTATKSLPTESSTQKKEAMIRQARSFFDPPSPSKVKAKAKAVPEESTKVSRQEEKREVSPAPPEDDDDGEDGEWGAKYVPNKDNIKKRPVAAGAPQGDGGMHEADVVFSDTEDEGEEGGGADTTPSKESRRKQRIIRTPTRSSKRISSSAEKKEKQKKKRSGSIKTPDDDGDEVGEESEESDDSTTGSPSKTKAKKARRQRASSESNEATAVHGAMDDFMESAALKAAAPGSGSKPKRKRLVEKVRRRGWPFEKIMICVADVCGREGVPRDGDGTGGGVWRRR